MAAPSGGQPHATPYIPTSTPTNIFVRSSLAAAGTWNVTGNDFTAGIPVYLNRGWNLVAAPYPGPGLLTSTIASEAPGCNVQEIATFSGGSYHTWTPAQGAAGAFLVTGDTGMWIECANAGSWTPS